MPRILLAEDEVLIRMALARMLEMAGYDVIQAGNGEEAVAALAAESPPALVLTDINMPGRVDGLELARRARQLRPTPPIVFTTGGTTLPQDEQPLGPRDHLVHKPYHPDTLVALVQGLLDQPVTSG